jgi:hypothetical protein
VRTCITGCMRTAFRIRRACGNGSRAPAAGAGEGGSSGRVEESEEVSPLLLGHLRRNRVTSPMVGSMILGLVAGRWLGAAAAKIPLTQLLIAGVVGIAAGLFFHFTHICPIVKRIWTPSWTLFSGGACFLLLAGFCWVIEVKRQKR